MSYFTVYVVDRVTHAEVCCGDLLTRSEAVEMMRFFKDHDIDAYFVNFYYKHGKRFEL